MNNQECNHDCANCPFACGTEHKQEGEGEKKDGE